MPRPLFPLGAPLRELLDGPVRPGRVAWIGLRPARRAPVLAVDRAELAPGTGLAGDRYAGGSGGAGARQVTLVAAEHLAAIAAYLGRTAPVAPEAMRRNVVVEGLNLLALKGRRFRVGAALLEWTGECHPCSRLEETVGAGAYNAARGHGGITARVLGGGAVALGDAVERLLEYPGDA